MSKTKERLYEYQEELERQHREEEDRLMAQFHQERLVEAENMQKEFDTEWEKELQVLTDQFDGTQKKKVRQYICLIVYPQRRVLLFAKRIFLNTFCVTNNELCKIFTDHAKKELAALLADI